MGTVVRGFGVVIKRLVHRISVCTTVFITRHTHRTYCVQKQCGGHVFIDCTAVVGFPFADLSMVMERFQSAGMVEGYENMHRQEAIWVGLTVFEQNRCLVPVLRRFRFICDGIAPVFTCRT